MFVINHTGGGCVSAASFVSFELAEQGFIVCTDFKSCNYVYSAVKPCRELNCVFTCESIYHVCPSDNAREYYATTVPSKYLKTMDIKQIDSYLAEKDIRTYAGDWVFRSKEEAQALANARQVQANEDIKIKNQQAYAKILQGRTALRARTKLAAEFDNLPFIIRFFENKSKYIAVSFLQPFADIQIKCQDELDAELAKNGFDILDLH